MKKLALISMGTLIIDQLVKWLVRMMIPLNNSISVISGFFHLTYVQNQGAAWSIFSGNRFFLILVAILALSLLYFYFLKGKNLNFWESMIYGLLVGGILGNFIDRVLLGYVIDYLEFIIFGYHYPIFNIADICIVISVFLLIVLIWRGDTKDGKVNCHELSK